MGELKEMLLLLWTLPEVLLISTGSPAVQRVVLPAPKVVLSSPVYSGISSLKTCSVSFLQPTINRAAAKRTIDVLLIIFLIVWF